MTPTTSEREAFEAWARASTSHNLVTIRDGRYIDPETACAWRAWQAALTREQREGVVSLRVTTRHPQDYVLHNELDGTKYRGTAEGRWKEEPQQEAPGAVACECEAAQVCGEAYQVVGCLLSDTGMFDTEHGEKILDNLSQARLVHKDVLPWHHKSATPPAPVDVRLRSELYHHLRSIRYNADNGSQDRPLHTRLHLISQEATEAIRRIEADILDGQPAGVECEHKWHPDPGFPEERDWVYCPKCGCSRRRKAALGGGGRGNG